MVEIPSPEPAGRQEDRSRRTSEELSDLLGSFRDLAGRDQEQLDSLAGLIDALRRVGRSRAEFDAAAIWHRVEESLRGRPEPGGTGGGGTEQTETGTGDVNDGTD